MNSPHRPLKTKIPLLALVGIALACSPGIAPAATDSPHTPLVQLSVDWPKFMAQHDLVWEQFPPSWNTGGFVGNGQLGMMIYATRDDNRVDFHLGRQDVTDHRKAPDRKNSFWVGGASCHYDFPRLDIGRMALRPAGKILSGTMRQNLWDAEVTGTIVTDLGELRFRALTLRDRMVQVIEVVSTEKSNGREASWTWEFLPGKPVAPRRFVSPKEPAGQGYKLNPDPQRAEVDGVPVCTQTLLAGGDYATAWLEKKADGGRKSTLYISTANEVPEAGKSAPLAARTVKEAVAEPLASLVEAHRSWWHAFYPASFLSVPDGRLESFFWIQLYKFASAGRVGGPLVDDQGPFFRINQWPYPTWDLNVQLTYWLPLASNHLDLEETFVRFIDEHFDQILKIEGSGKTIGDVAWLLHNYYWCYSFAGDNASLRAVWQPKAAALADLYLKRLRREPDGKLHLPQTQSPEYPVKNQTFDDSNYNLALLRWLLHSLLEVTPDAPEAARWRETLADLTPFVTGPDGLMIGKDQPVEMSHRHFSHLLALYPLFQLNPDNAADRDLVDRSVTHWHHIDGGKLLAGYSFSGAALLYAALGRGDDANAMLQKFFGAPLGSAFMSQNTFYFESGGKNPTIETPLSAGSAIMDLLLQSWGGKLRVFPATPTAWKEASFYHLRGQGGFLVSAQREAGRTAWVAVKSEAGLPCHLKVLGWNGPLKVSGNRTFEVTTTAPSEYDIDLKAGEEVLLAPAGSGRKTAEVRPVSHPVGELNRFGVRQGEKVPTNQVWPETLPSDSESPAPR